MENPPLPLFDVDSAAHKPAWRKEFNEAGLMRRRETSINDVPIREQERRFTWPVGPRPADFPGLTALGR